MHEGDEGHEGKKRSPALRIGLNRLPAPACDGLVALLADYDLVAIHEDDPVSPQVWTAHFATARARDAAADAVRVSKDLQTIAVETVEVEDEDWARRTQADLPAIRIGRVIVAPPWDLPHPASRTPHPVIVVVIEPSRGFGTGHHQSTRLCITLLQSRNVIGQTVIDIGTGSGVLAITAAKLGAAFVAAIDLDPDAIDNARENIAANGVADVVEAHVEDFTTASRSSADIVTANLTGSLLARRAMELARFVRPGGTLIVSGFNVDERPMVEEAFASTFAVTESAEEEGWAALVLSRLSTPNSQLPTPNSQLPSFRASELPSFQRSGLSPQGIQGRQGRQRHRFGAEREGPQRDGLCARSQSLFYLFSGPPALRADQDGGAGRNVVIQDLFERLRRAIDRGLHKDQ